MKSMGKTSRRTLPQFFYQLHVSKTGTPPTADRPTDHEMEKFENAHHRICILLNFNTAHRHRRHPIKSDIEHNNYNGVCRFVFMIKTFATRGTKQFFTVSFSFHSAMGSEPRISQWMVGREK